MAPKISKDEKATKLSAALKANMKRRKSAKEIKSSGELYLGLMSGTSLDGVDASLIRTNAEDKIEFLGNFHLPYPEAFKVELKNLLDKVSNLVDISEKARSLLEKVEYKQVETNLTNFHIFATASLLKKTNLKSSQLKAIGFHGQTIYHNPSQKISWQIGDAELMAKTLRSDIIYDFRSKDIEFNGQGAPLVPVFHKAITAGLEMPLAVLNIGGVANLTYIDHETMAAFDTGPGNALINDAMMKYYGKDFDEDGKVAASGSINQALIEKALEADYFKANYPKSLDRNYFNSVLELMKYLSPADLIANLTFFTASSIALSLKSLPKFPKALYLCGGGVHNQQMIKWLKSLLLNNCEVVNISSINPELNPDYIESAAFAYLAARFCHNLPSSFPSTTGTSQEIICGKLCAARN